MSAMFSSSFRHFVLFFRLFLAFVYLGESLVKQSLFRSFLASEVLLEHIYYGLRNFIYMGKRESARKQGTL